MGRYFPVPYFPVSHFPVGIFLFLILPKGKWETGKYGTGKYARRIKMGYLVLVRHGQARMFEKDSDQLSPLGEEQARMLARFWIREGLKFDEVYSGALVRQRRTAEIA